jgi:hypothetical protein
MKLVNLLGTAALAALFAAGCSSTTTDSTDAATDTAKADTTPPTDTPAETTPEVATDTGPTCGDCTTAKCGTEFTACNADTTCKGGIDCLNACPTPDPGNACANKCITDHADTKFQDLATCLSTNCKSSCFPS